MRWSKLRKIAVCGSRKFEEQDLATQYIDQYIRKNFKSTEDVVIITGGAVGVDAAIERYCFRRGIKNLIVHARWLELELVAGPRRNGHIVDLADQVFAFWNYKSTGTKDTITKTKERGKPCKVIGVKKLRKILKVKPPAKIYIPRKTSTRDAKRIRELVMDANFDELIRRRK